MKLAIVGSRSCSEADALIIIRSYLDKVKPYLIISGGCYGPDKAAEIVARERMIQFEECPADWNGLGKAAGPIRNTDIAKKCDQMLALWDGNTKKSGTLDAISKAVYYGKCVVIISVSQQQ
jgi:hypothetical protein